MKKLYFTSFFILLFVNLIFAQIKPDFEKTKAEHAQLAEQKEKFYKRMLAGSSLITPNQENYDVKFYGIILEIDPGARTITGETEVRAIVVSDSLQQVELNLLGNMQVSDVLADTTSLNFSHVKDLLTVILPRTLKKNDAFNFKVAYSGSPAQSGLGAFGFDSHNGLPMIWSLSEPYGARNWWACKDFPSDKADSVDINVTVPAELIVASNGTLSEVIDLGTKKTYCWRERYPIATYLVSIAIYPYYVYSDWYKYSDTDSMEITFFVYPDHADMVADNYAKTKDMIKAFSELFGPYPFIEEKYGHAEFVWGGGMEHQTITSLGGWGEWLIAHELSHQWWGDMVTCNSFHHIWLNEGFARYSEALWDEVAYGERALHSAQASVKYFGSGTIYIEDPENDVIFHTGLSYNKASWILHMLRHVIGDATFFELLRTYYAHPAHQFGTATTEQFKALAEEVSGQDLDAYFHQWIYQEGFPVYAYSWNAQQNEDSTYTVNGGIVQNQTLGPIFQMPVDITIRTAATETTFVLPVKQKITPFEFTLSEEPVDVLLDKDDWILCQIEKISAPMLAAASIQINDSPGNNNGHLDPGETVELGIQLRNLGATITGASGTLTSSSPYITIFADKADFGDLDFGTNVLNTTPFIISALNSILPHSVRLSLNISCNEGYRFNLDIFIDIGTGSVLLVDDDNGENYEGYYQQMADQNQIKLNHWCIANQGLPTDTLDAYDIVFWFTGNDAQTSLTADEQLLLQSFLNRGGRLALSGSNIGYDLVEDGSQQDSLFFTNTLHALFEQDIAGSERLLGIPGDPVAGGISVHFTGQYGGAGNQNSPSIIAPLDSAVTVMTYLPGHEPAAIRCENLDTRSRLIYFAFGLEGIAGPREDAAANLFQRTITWLAGITSAVEKTPETASIPTVFSLSQNYPNPFNSVTYFRVQIPKATFVSVKIYNALGQRIRVLFEGQKLPGIYEVTWDSRAENGNAVGSGVYFYELTADEFSQTNKMLLLR
ncbi:T9SS type A sorting domain-containing protein [candidate division KSB1 bacterium]|nr:T9SS type A sorting domain-containing protein [candidate division KSB1 bacterium]